VDFSKHSLSELQQMQRRARRLLKEKAAQDSMLDYMQVMRPDPEHPDDSDYSAFEATPLAKLLCDVIEKVDRGELKRVCVSVGPQLGKSEVLSRGAPSWLSGRKPRRKMILGTYNGDFAAEFGGEVRDFFLSPTFKNVFPDHELKGGSEAKDNLGTTQNGRLSFVGVGGSGTGKTADIFIIDDPFKNDEDAQSEAYREKVWKWFNAVAMTRCHKNSAIIIIHTRWHEDDLIGRLCDPDHPERNKKYKGISEKWTYFNLPAVVKDPALAKALNLKLQVPQDPFVQEHFGKEPMVSLWEERKSLQFLAEAKMLDDRTFGALYMGKPTPDSGTYFTESMLVEYHDPRDLPDNLLWYGASDHAVSEKRKADYTVAGCVGVDDNNDIWIPPDVTWERMETDKSVDEIVYHMRVKRPLCWWMESELISKSFGPFLKRRMLEEKVYTTLIPKVPSTDKRARARAIQGRMSMRKVHFPAFAPWWPEAKRQLLTFPYGSHDDFVDWLAWIGLGLMEEVPASKPSKEEEPIKTGTIAWVKKSAGARERNLALIKGAKGW